MELAFLTEERGAAPNAAGERHKVCEASGTTENPGNNNERLMEEICEPENVKEATRRVTGNKGSAGTDGMSVEELPKYLSENWERMKAELIEDRYKPQPVRRVEIPKATGGVRRLGIPTVKDRVVQQMVLQVLQKRWDKTFSESSYGFRPGRNAHQAVAQAQEYIEEGNGWVVDMDLEKFFDLVNHDKLMGQVAKRVKDKRVLRLLRGFLNAGVLEEGLVKPREEGTPQGGPISPLLSNLYLDELDRELEKRRHKFVRYADDCNIYVRSQRAGERVMRSMSKYITLKLKLKVNESKSAVAQPHERKILGFSFTSGGKVKKRLAPQTVEKYKRKIREITRRTKGYNKKTIITLKKYLSGWIGYYGRCQTPSVLKELEGWMRRRLRAMIWEQLKNGRRRYAALRKQGVEEELAASTAGSSKGSWRISLSRALTTAFPNAYFAKAGIPKLAVCIKPIN